MPLISSTIKMQKQVIMAVIDKIQMIPVSLQAKEIYIYGEPSAMPLVKSICQSTKVSIKTFSEMLINIKNLYLDTQLQQAKLFNDSNSGFDILVASDTTGIELNL
ncbi:hypothetical protein C2G38_2233343 [Gigaspora rosea]|uniref:Uncharacterized protein n=1 Tax=Gigaspora rosea TaxID=44941 RepID=A0A397TR89_9GLOM|nr:hypothetical protein C2G38_2233343 [Gigaspora rosea]